MNYRLSHMNKAYIFIAAMLICRFGTIHAQSDIRIGEWKSYLPHNNVQLVEQSSDKIIYATEQSIFTLDKLDGSIEYLSKVEGLTETGIRQMEYSDINELLIIAYENSVIDLISSDEVFPVFDLFNNRNFVDRRINDLFVQDGEWLYLATGFGLVQYNLIDREFGFTLDTGQAVNAVHGNSSYLVIATAGGAYLLDYENSVFPNAFSSWQKLEAGLPEDYPAGDIRFVDDRLYLADDTQLYRSDALSDFTPVYDFSDEGFALVFLDTYENNMVLGLKDATVNSKLVFLDEMDIPVNEIGSCTNRLLDLEIDALGKMYFADEWLFVRSLEANGNCNQLVYRGPFSDEASDIDIKDDVIYVASGGITDNFGDLFGRNGIYILEQGQWNNINQDNNSFYIENDVLQFYQIEAHPDDNIVYIGSFWAGLVEHNLDTDNQVLYTAENTDNALLPAVGDALRTRVSGLAFDSQDNLWISCYNAARPLAVYTQEQTWHNFDLPGDDKLADIVIDDLGYVWAVIAGNTGAVVVFDPGQSIQDPTDDRPGRLFNVGNSELPSNLVNCIAKDLDGAIWVGTAQGVVVFECGGATFEDICQGDKPIVFQDNVGAFLLETEDVLSIAVDGANRKWFGTRSGIFVQSENGEEQIAQYSVDNSPLFDNNVKALAYNENTGEMFISTNRGMQSFRTVTTGARNFHSANVYAYPNPVRPEYTGTIAIKGLARDAEVKITDINGHLVFQTEALGGQAIWDGRDGAGREVSGGVYMVFSSSSDAFLNPDTAVTKILIVR